MIYDICRMIYDICRLIYDNTSEMRINLHLTACERICGISQLILYFGGSTPCLIPVPI